MRNSPSRQSRSGRRAAGFTMIEMMTVIGIILILMGLFLVAGKYVQNSARSKSTKTALATAKSLLGDYDQATHLQIQPSVMQQNGGSQPCAAGSQHDFWFGPPSPAVDLGGEYANGNSAGPSGLITIDSPTVATNDAVYNTGVVMTLILANPAAKATIANLPASSVNATLLTPVFGKSTPILLDGWGNPIVYVPASGLANVVIGGSVVNGVRTGGMVGIVTSTGFHTGTYTLSPLDRPFFASAGPSGDLSNGDDNIYSFENQ